VARALHEKGFTLVRPLAGGLDGWIEAGLPTEAEELVAVRAAIENRNP